jgi:predicted nucleotidyltransferase
MRTRSKTIAPNVQVILERLETINLYKVILFGSYAYGTPHRDSDIDLLVVTNDDFFPKTYKEKSDVYVRVSNVLSDLAATLPIDLIVYTKPMYEKFVELGSLFSQQVLQQGVVMYEDDYERMAEQSQR